MKNISLLALMMTMLSAGIDAQITGADCDIIFNNCEEQVLEYLTENIGLNNCFQWEDDCGATQHLYRSGKVAIGTSVVPSGASLAVKGGIVSNLIKVELCETEEWCDYVFEQDYELMDICDVEAFIEEHGHLPNTPSAAQIEKEGGFELKTVKLNHQEKIEEVFLYMIGINEQIKSLKTQIDRLEAENEKLRKS